MTKAENWNSTADLTPIPLTRSPVISETPLSAAGVPQGTLRGRVEQQVDAITDSANKVISGVVDSSFGILKSFMPTNNPGVPPPPASEKTTHGTPGRTGFGLLRRESGFSIANLAASLPITGRARTANNPEESGQQLVTVSRPSSMRSPKSRSRSRSSLKIKVGDGETSSDSSSEEEESGSSSDENASDAAEEDEAQKGKGTDGKSIRSFESMLSFSKENRDATLDSKQRKTLSDRLASVSALAGGKVSGSPFLTKTTYKNSFA